MIKITIKTNNAAFQDGKYGQEVGSILKHIAYDFDSGNISEKSYRDTNGNTVAKVKIK